jgi:sporulation protein YlmC with PRC-barrel domain
MPTFEFHFGAQVISDDGRLVGTLESLIVEQEGFDPHSIVVKEDDGFAGRRFAPGSWYFHDKVLVPVKAIAHATPENIQLQISSGEVRRLSPYLSYRYRQLDAGEVGRTFAALAGSGIATPNVDEIPAKAADELEVTRDENVMLGHAGRKLGQVRQVLVEDGELIGIVMHPHGLFTRDVIVPIRFLQRSDDLALFVDLSEEDLERLKLFES